MTVTLQALEDKLDVAFSKTFRRFWNAHVPDRTPRFQVETSRLSRAAFADVGPHPKYGWLIRVRDDRHDVAGLEIRLAHELLHLVLDKEGYPAVCRSDEALPKGWSPREWDEVMKLVHSILCHPVISLRMRHWGFATDEHLSKEIRDTLEVLETHCIPDPDDFVYWRLWVLTYVLNRLDGGDQVCTYIARRAASVAEQGEEYSKWLDSAGYSEPQHLTAPKVIEVGQSFLSLLEVHPYYLLCVMEDGDFVKAPELGEC